MTNNHEKNDVISKIMTSGLPNKLKLVKDNNSNSDTNFSYIISRFSSQKKIQKAKLSSFLQIRIIIQYPSQRTGTNYWVKKMQFPYLERNTYIS